jgi:hypothetical protein
MMLQAARAWPAVAALVMPLWGIAVAQSGPPGAANTAARAAITACVARIADAPTGLSELELHCPELGASLEVAQVRPLIIPSSRDLLDRNSLIQLRRLLHPAIGPAPSGSKLAPIVQGLQGTRVAPRSWLRRLWDWVLERLNRKNQSESSNTWLDELVRQLAGAQWLWKAIIWGSLIAFPLLVVIIVTREVRAMGRRSSDPAVTAGETAAAGIADSRLARLRLAPLGQRPAGLFAMLISRLVAAGRLPPDRSLTHREVVRTAVLDDADQRRYLESLARLSERQLYSGSATTADDLEELLARGEDLYTTGWGRSVEG